MIKWMRKVLLSDCTPSVICFFLLLKMDYSILSSWPQNQSIDNRVKLALLFIHLIGNDSNLLIVFYVQIMPDDLVMQLHRF